MHDYLWQSPESGLASEILISCNIGGGEVEIKLPRDPKSTIDFYRKPRISVYKDRYSDPVFETYLDGDSELAKRVMQIAERVATPKALEAAKIQYNKRVHAAEEAQQTAKEKALNKLLGL